MSNELPEARLTFPSHSSHALHNLCIALAGILREEAASDTSRQALQRAVALAGTAELFAAEIAHFFGSRTGADHALLEQLQARYVKEHMPE